MTASQSGQFNVQEFSDLGAPLSGGRLYTYAFGTTTLKVAYTDNAGSIPHTYTNDGSGGQYIALNARGELPAPLYLTTGSYDLALKNADGSTVWTRRADPTGDMPLNMGNVSGVLPVSNGGTGGSTAIAARAALGVAPMANRIDIASAAGTVDLTAMALNTDDIQITGSLAITGFTIASGRVIRVLAGGGFSLVSSANIVTQTGSSIVMSPGDTFMLRATAPNVVEVLFYTKAASSVASSGSSPLSFTQII